MGVDICHILSLYSYFRYRLAVLEGMVVQFSFVKPLTMYIMAVLVMYSEPGDFDGVGVTKICCEILTLYTLISSQKLS